MKNIIDFTDHLIDIIEIFINIMIIRQKIPKEKSMQLYFKYRLSLKIKDSSEINTSSNITILSFLKSKKYRCEKEDFEKINAYDFLN